MKKIVNLMRNTIAILFLIVLATSCGRKTCPEVSVSAKDSVVIKDILILRDSIINRPGESLFFGYQLNWQYEGDSVIRIPKAKTASLLTMNESEAVDSFIVSKTVKQGNITAHFDINRKGVINVNCKTDSFQQRIEWLEHRLYKLHFKENVKTVPCPPVSSPIIPKPVLWLLGISLAGNAWQFRYKLVSGGSLVFQILKKLIIK